MGKCVIKLKKYLKCQVLQRNWRNNVTFGNFAKTGPFCSRKICSGENIKYENRYSQGTKILFSNHVLLFSYFINYKCNFYLPRLLQVQWIIHCSSTAQRTTSLKQLYVTLLSTSWMRRLVQGFFFMYYNYRDQNAIVSQE